MPGPRGIVPTSVLLASAILPVSAGVQGDPSHGAADTIPRGRGQGQPRPHLTGATAVGLKSEDSPAEPPDPLMARIHMARLAAGRPPLSPLPLPQVETNSAYLRPVLQTLLRNNSCDHDLNRWEAVRDEAARQGQQLMPTSEVLACPRAVAQWNPSAIVSLWLTSPVHINILLNRPRASHIGCVRFEEDGRTVAVCTLWSPSGS